MDEFVRTHADQPWMGAVLGQLAAEYRSDAGSRTPDLPVWYHISEPEGNHLDGAIAYLQFLIRIDRKSTPLKELQGRLWRDGYESGQLRAEVYDDVPPAFARWTQQGRRLAIYSSGSVLAQKLLFAHTTHGDLTPYLSGYFDTTTGPKREAASYALIAQHLDVASGEMHFLTDLAAEAEAAANAGVQTTLIARHRAEAPPGALAGFANLYP